LKNEAPVPEVGQLVFSKKHEKAFPWKLLREAEMPRKLSVVVMALVIALQAVPGVLAAFDATTQASAAIDVADTVGLGKLNIATMI